MNPVHALPSYFHKIQFNIILPPTPVFRVVCSLQASQPKFCSHISSLMRATCPSISSSWLDHPSNIQWRIKIRKLLIMQFSPYISYDTFQLWQHSLHVFYPACSLFESDGNRTLSKQYRWSCINVWLREILRKFPCDSQVGSTGLRHGT
jgi:hypothetical protein